MEQKEQIIDRFRNARTAALLELDKLKKEQVKIVGYYCTYTPVELVLAAGAVPLRLGYSADQYIQQGEFHLPRNLCPLVKSNFGEAVSGTSPYFQAVDIVIWETTCDGKKKMYEYLREYKPTCILQLPQTSSGTEEKLLWQNAILGLKSFLEQQLAVEITDERLIAAIKQKNRHRQALQDLFKLWRTRPGALRSAELFSVLANFDYRLDQDKALEDVDELLQHLQNEPPAAYSAQPGLPRILLTGCPLVEKLDRMVNIIEDAGGELVCLETCDWLKGTRNLVQEDTEPLSAIAEKYLQIPCPVMTPNTNRKALIAQLIDDYQIDGVIDFVLPACLTYSVEAVPMERFVKGRNTGYLRLESNLTPADNGQLSTRVGAFIEMLSQRRKP